MKLSIITTTYNSEKYILKAINSVNQQEFDGYFDVEYIIIDDCSTDNTLSVIEDYFNKFKNSNIDLKIEKLDTNHGCGYSRKKGIEISSGDFFMFLDSDDYYLHKNFCNTAFHQIIDNKCDMIEYGVNVNYTSGENEICCVPEKITFNDMEKAVIMMFDHNTIRFSVWSKIISKHIVNSYPYSVSREFEDIETIPIWVFNCKKIMVMPNIEINYRARKNSIIRQGTIQTKINTVNSISTLFEFFYKNKKILKSIYKRSLIDLEYGLLHKTSDDVGFNEFAKLNKYMLSYIYPDKFNEMCETIDNIKNE